VVQAAIGGQAITQVFEGEKHFELILRWAEPYRRDVHSIRNVLVSVICRQDSHAHVGGEEGLQFGLYRSRNGFPRGTAMQRRRLQQLRANHQVATMTAESTVM
jgi:hypothetical protein